MYAYTMVDIERGGQGPDGGIGIYIVGNHTKYTKYHCIPVYAAIQCNIGIPYTLPLAI